MGQARYSEFLEFLRLVDPTEIIPVIMGSASWSLWVYGPQKYNFEWESML